MLSNMHKNVSMAGNMLLYMISKFVRLSDACQGTVLPSRAIPVGNVTDRHSMALLLHNSLVLGIAMR